VTPVYDAGRQATKVRLVLWASALVCGVCLWQGNELFQTYGVRPADGGVLAPLAVRTAWGLCVALAGAACFAGMWIYGRRYVAAIRMDEAGGLVEIDTLGLAGPRTLRVPASAVHIGRFHEGYLSTPKATVHAPWTTMRVDGLSRRLILDEQGRLLDPDFAKRLRAAARPTS